MKSKSQKKIASSRFVATSWCNNGNGRKQLKYKYYLLHFCKTAVILKRHAASAVDAKYTGLWEAICRSVVGGSVGCHRKLREILMVELARSLCATEGSGSAAACVGNL